MAAHNWIRPKLRARILAGEIPFWLRVHPRRQYVTQAVLATPPWVDRHALKQLAVKRDEMTKRTGIEHTIDHIVPLNHPRVCGLNVPWNLRVVPKASNAKKLNAWCEWHGELFNEPEQFNLFK